jgi:tyrosyl-tRNA synthetase
MKLTPLPPEAQLAELKRGTDEILVEKDLLAKLKKSYETKKPLLVKLGCDPTAPDLHLGHTVPLRKLAQFQEFGHKVVFLIGDFTGLVGDPSGKSKTRPQLTKAEVLANAETYKRQVFKILDSEATEVRFNSEWLDKLTAYDFVRLASHANVARMLEREDFNKRYKEGQSISLHEFMYPLLQAYDSVALKADIELGGRDQKFNLLLGRELMRDFDLEPQVCLTFPLLEGLDGVQKMSKSTGNYVGVTEGPNEMYGKLMSLPDAMLRRYYDMLSPRSSSEIEKVFSELGTGKLHPKEAKSRFALDVVTQFHSGPDAAKARDHFEKVFSRKEIPDQLPEFHYAWQGKQIWVPKLLHEIGFAASTSEGKRLVAQGGVKIDEVPLTDENYLPNAHTAFVLQCGKRKFARILLP